MHHTVSTVGCTVTVVGTCTTTLEVTMDDTVDTEGVMEKDCASVVLRTVDEGTEEL